MMIPVCYADLELAFLVASGASAVQRLIDNITVYHAYNDRDGVTHQFIMNGLSHANDLLGYEAFAPDDWQAMGEYDTVGERHRAFVIPQKDMQIEGVSLKAGEKIRIEESYKYNHDQALTLFTNAGVVEGARFTNSAGSYGQSAKSTPLFPLRQHL